MFLLWQFFVRNLLYVVLVLFLDICVNFCLQLRWPQWLLVCQSIIIIIIIIILFLDDANEREWLFVCLCLQDIAREISGPIFMKFGMDLIPLETNPNSYF
jgi:hypothetical protein